MTSTLESKARAADRILTTMRSTDLPLPLVVTLFDLVDDVSMTYDNLEDLTTLALSVDGVIKRTRTPGLATQHFHLAGVIAGESFRATATVVTDRQLVGAR